MIENHAPTPVFSAPWQAQAFGLALKLHEAGVFTWKEWADTLAQVIREAQAGGDPDLGDTYYVHWVNAVERLLIQRRVTDGAAIAALARQIEEEAEHLREGASARHGSQRT
jgi:nitrile hydratase accessory protein